MYFTFFAFGPFVSFYKMCPFVMGPFVAGVLLRLGPLVMGPFVMGPYEGVPYLTPHTCYVLVRFSSYFLHDYHGQNIFLYYLSISAIPDTSILI